MRSRTVGVAVGLVVSGLSIAGNLWRGDPHLVTTVPGLFTALTMVAVIVLGVCLVVIREPATRSAGRRATLLASGVFAACLGMFTLLYLPIHSLTIAGFSAVTGFVLVYLVGFAASFVARRAGPLARV
jgi:hypothetical protein